MEQLCLHIIISSISIRSNTVNLSLVSKLLYFQHANLKNNNNNFLKIRPQIWNPRVGISPGSYRELVWFFVGVRCLFCCFVLFGSFFLLFFVFLFFFLADPPLRPGTDSGAKGRPWPSGRGLNTVSSLAKTMERSWRHKFANFGQHSNSNSASCGETGNPRFE